jgi:hypothetical protein
MKRVAIILFLIALLFTACSEKRTNDPVRAYTYWAGEKPNDIKVINGQYWESAHWSKEYILYMELKATRLWRKEFIKQNNLVVTTDYEIPDDAPSWFKLNSGFKMWKPSGFDQGSLYLEDSVTEHFFIYEIQL